ncbi:TnsA-like heteromeric transposase endonuclease subunit [Spirillospora sp. NPDC050679]
MAGLALAVRPGNDFRLRYLAAAGQELHEPLATGWRVRFERAAPVRTFPSYRGQRNFPGWWWSATTGELVGFESWLKRDQVMLLDFSPEVVAFASQPFWLTWPDPGQRRQRRRHAPDYFARLRDGTGVVIDVRADDRIGPSDAEVFEATAAACDLVGWQYRRVGEVAEVLRANVGWLADYRHRRCRDERYAGLLTEALQEPVALLAAARSVGDPMAVLPTLFHLMWSRVVVADLASAPLSGETVIEVGGQR